jgi:hypothetical protein
MKWKAVIVLFLSATVLFAQADRKQELADRIVGDLFSFWSEADIPSKYSFLVWPAYKELSKETNWPRLEFIRDISTVGDLLEIWPSREALAQAVYQNIPRGVLKEYVDLAQAQEETASRAGPVRAAIRTPGG